MTSTIPTLKPDDLRVMIDPQSLGVESTAQLAPLDSIIGQQRAVAALQFGLGMRELGFNIYVAGEPGIGKMTAVKTFLEATAAGQPPRSAWCYVNNFQDSYQPKVLRLPQERARALQRDVKALIERLRRDVPHAFESEEYVAQRDELGKKMDQRRNDILVALRSKAYEAQIGLQMTPYGILTVPLKKGEPIPEPVFEALTPEERNELRRRNEDFQEVIRASMKQNREVDRAAQEQLEALNKQVAQYIVGGLLEDLLEKYRDQVDIVGHLKAMQDDILNNIEHFKAAGPEPQDSLGGVQARDLAFRKYEVNVLVDDGERTGAPVVVEMNPSYPNLFGRIEKESHYGLLHTDFTMIKPGALHRANGGYLVLPVEEVLRNGYAWESLKRALRGQYIQIEELGELLGLFTSKSLKPQPIPLDLKVILVGRPLWYQLLYSYDEDFGELFKVKADFDSEMDRNDANVQHMLQFFHTMCVKEHLRQVEGAGAAKLIEYAIRLAGDQRKLSTHFGLLADTLREANYWANQDHAPQISAVHVNVALEKKVYRANLLQEHLHEMITRGTLLIDTGGAAVGQVNGLSVLALGDYDFGQPIRITASVEPGRAGIINIEREVALSGPIHSKGVLILSGYLAYRFGRNKPIALSARLVFEQSYSGVEGDSASSAELYALLSALSGLPIKQGIAVTGSVNQHGEVQAIGGVNEKIEGFFDVCRAKGLTGEQGVLIPASNVQTLMLREDVIEAVRQKQFNIWAVTTIEEGIEVLTGVPARAPSPYGFFDHHSVNALVDERLKNLSEDLGASPLHTNGSLSGRSVALT